MTSVFSWQNTITLRPGSFCTPKPILSVTPGLSWLPTFAFQSPVMKRISLGGVSSKGLVSLHRIVQLQLLQHYWSGHRLGLLWYWIFALEMNRNHSVIFEISSKYFISDYCWLLCPLNFFSGIPAHGSRYNGHLSEIHPFQSILVRWFLECQCSLLPSPVWPLPVCLDSWT